MSKIDWELGNPRTFTLAFDEPKTGEGVNGKWIMYGFKNGDLSSDEDCFFATETLHAMIKTLWAGEGDEITIEKCQGDSFTFFKVNGLTLDDMKSGGSAEKTEEAKPNPPKASLEVVVDERIKKLEIRVGILEAKSSNQLTDDDIPF